MDILVVDADALFARLLKAKLEAMGHQVCVEHDGAAAAELIVRQPFRLVVLAQDLPGLDGGALCARIRAQPAHHYTYVMFYTERADKDGVIACLEAGADAVLAKPLDPVELQLRLRACGRLQELEDRLRQGSGLDDATGAVNPAAFRAFFRVVLGEARRVQAIGVLLRISVCNYQAVLAGDGYGPAEAMMAQVAQLLMRLSRESDLVARVEQDGFCLLLQHTSREKCRPLLDKIETLSRSISVLHEGRAVCPELAMTAVDYPQGDSGVDALLAPSPVRATAPSPG